MTNPTPPFNIDTIIPTKYKGIAALIGTGLTFALPYLLEAQKILPSPWPVVIGVVLWAATVTGVTHAPYVPKGAVLAPDTQAVAVAAQAAVTQSAVQQATVPGPVVPYPNTWNA